MMLEAMELDVDSGVTDFHGSGTIKGSTLSAQLFE
jgi:hypothetical protein